MSESRISWEILNAYIDGELDRTTSARVADAVARDTMTASRVATLAQLKANTVGIEISREHIPAIPSATEKNTGRSYRSYAVAAALALFVLAGIGSEFPGVHRSNSTWLDHAITAELQWIASADKTPSRGEAVVTIGATMSERALDLSDAQLKLVYVAPTSQLGRGEGSFLGYRGLHGCMVGLWVSPSLEDLGPTPAVLDTKGILVRAWRGRNATYAILSRGMDPARIDQLAKAVARLLDPDQKLDEDLHVALRHTTRIGTACRT